MTSITGQAELNNIELLFDKLSCQEGVDTLVLADMYQRVNYGNKCEPEVLQNTHNRNAAEMEAKEAVRLIFKKGDSAKIIALLDFLYKQL